jgi:hypothetical protein
MVKSVPKLIFPNGFTKAQASEARDRGYLSHVLVELPVNRYFPIFFYDIVRLQQDLEECSKHGCTFIGDPGMIVLREITLATMQASVQLLYENGFFDHFIPLSQEQLRRTKEFEWPPKGHATS